MRFLREAGQGASQKRERRNSERREGTARQHIDEPRERHTVGNRRCSGAESRAGCEPKRERRHSRTPCLDRFEPKLAAIAEAEGFKPPWAFTQTVFKFYSSFVACRLLLLFNNPNCRKISGLTARLSDNSGFLLCFILFRVRYCF